MKLGELQWGFRGWLLDGSDQLTSELGSAARDGLEVYRNNYRSQLESCIQNAFPITLEWMGRTAFHSALESHIDSVAPGSWTLDAYPAGFPPTLGRLFPARKDFHELASFECTLTQAFVGGDALAAQLGQLAGIEWESARFELAPSFRLIHQETNASEIWSALKHGRRRPRRKTYKVPRVVLVWRSDEICQFRCAERLEGTALELIATGASFGEVCEAICTILSPDAASEAAGKWLGKWLSDGYVTRVTSA